MKFSTCAVILLLAIGSFLPIRAWAEDCNPTGHVDEAGLATGVHAVAATPLQIQFDSGARWDLCWHIDTHVGLVLSRVFYAAPAEASRQVLDAASLGQILLKYDEEPVAQHLLSETGLGGSQVLPIDSPHCQMGDVLSGINEQQLCQRFRQINHLSKVRHSDSQRRHEVSLHSWSRIDSHIYQQIWRLSEDGEISPSVVFSGQVHRYTNDARFGSKINESPHFAANATLLFNWRLDFNINSTPNNDRVDEIEFPATITDVVRRTISVRNLPVETLRVTDRRNFRGWRISDAEYSSGTESGIGAATRIGYYLDPQTAGHNYTSRAHNWSQFDFFLTARHPCEKLASANHLLNSDCGRSLDYFTNGENLLESDSVVWFSISRHFAPRREDHPAISAIESGFKIIPFDWSAHTPFSPPDDSDATSKDRIRALSSSVLKKIQ